MAGFNLKLWVAIDFTSSNNDQIPKLHSVNWQDKNYYTEAIYSVCQIMEQYDTDEDNRFPTYGFGGCPKYLGKPNNLKVDHCFRLGDKEAKNDCLGSAVNIVHTYRRRLQEN